MRMAATVREHEASVPVARVARIRFSRGSELRRLVRSIANSTKNYFSNSRKRFLPVCSHFVSLPRLKRERQELA
jgi:hypothetical protein